MTTETHDTDQDIDFSIETDPGRTQMVFAYELAIITSAYRLLIMSRKCKIGDTDTHAMAADLATLIRIIDEG